MGHHRFFDSDSDEEIAVHTAGKTGAAAGKQPPSAKWPRVLIRYTIRIAQRVRCECATDVVNASRRLVRCRHPSPQPRGDGGYSITQKGFRERLGIEIVTRDDRSKAASSSRGGWSNRELGAHAGLIFFLAFFLCVGAFTDQINPRQPVFVCVLFAATLAYLAYVTWRFCCSSRSNFCARWCPCGRARSKLGEDDIDRGGYWGKSAKKKKISINLNPIGLSKNNDEYIDIDV